MTTDDDLDARLLHAGARWRAANATAATVDLHAAALVEPDARTTVTTEVPLVHETRTPRRRRRIWLGAVAGMAAAIAAAFVVAIVNRPATTPASGGDAQTLTRTHWQLEYAVFGSGPRLTATKGETLRFEDGRLVAFDGTNTISGPAKITGDHLRISDLASTAIGNAPGYVSDGIDLTKVMPGELRWSIDGRTLTLTNGSLGTLVFTAKTDSTTTDPQALLGIKWTLTTITNGTGPDASSSSVNVPPVFLFQADSVLIAGGCNSGGGTARAGAGVLDIDDDRISTSNSCVPALSTGQRLILTKILSGHSTWSITDGQLTITKAGVGSLVFDRDDIDPGFTGVSGSPSDLPSATSTE